MSFEVLGVEGEVLMQLTVASQDMSNVVGQIEASYPMSEAFETEDVIHEETGQLQLARGYRLRRSHLFTLREGHRTEPYTALMGFLSTLGSGDIALFQVLFMPVGHNWQRNILRVSCDPFDHKKSMFPDMPQLPKKAEAKVSKPLFAVSVRMAASSDELLSMLEGSFLSQFQNEENSLVPMPMTYPIEAIVNRTTYTTGMLLNAGELAALVHIPNPNDVPEALAAAEPGAPAPRLAKEDILVPLGWNHYRGIDTPVGISEEWLTRHVAIFGASGSGKSTLLLWFLSIAEDKVIYDS